MARRNRYRWNDWRVDTSGRSIKSNPKKDRARGKATATKPPSKKQIAFIDILCEETGESVKRPGTSSEASAIIDRLKASA